MITIVLPAFSGRRPTSIAAAIAAPEENADRNPVEPRHQPGGVERGLIADDDDFVDHAAIENGGNEARADALNLVRTRGAPAGGGQPKSSGSTRDHAHAGLARFSEPGRPR